MKDNDIQLSHPDFAYSYARGFEGRPTLIFSRPTRKEPTAAEIQKFRTNKAIVEAHGGYMPRNEFELGEKIPCFNRADLVNMLLEIRHELKDWRIVGWWNGCGSHSFSVSITPRSDTFTRFMGRNRSQDFYQKHPETWEQG